VGGSNASEKKTFRLKEKKGGGGTKKKKKEGAARGKRKSTVKGWVRALKLSVFPGRKGEVLCAIQKKKKNLPKKIGPGTAAGRR